MSGIPEVPVNADVEELNRRYGAPGRIVFRPSPTGHPFVALANKYGTAEISLYGAHTLAYRPTGNLPALFMSKLTDYRPGTAIRGGIPVCWPWFGACGEPGSKAHGFARTSVWSVRSSEYSEDESALVLGLRDSEATRRIWPHRFDLEFRISVTMKLNLSLKTTNTGDAPFKITEGLHPYFLVKDRDATTVRGVAGCDYVDARDMSEHVQTGDLAVTEDVNHVFKPSKNEFALIDPGLRRAIAVVSRGNGKLVVWNPGPVEEGRFENLAPDDWKSFVCVEPATLFREDAVEIKPGESRELCAGIQSVPEK